MLRTISLKKLVQLPKLKLKNDGKIYDKEWHMWFSCEEDRKEFVNAIDIAEQNIKQGKYHTQEEVDEYFSKKYGI